MTTNVESFVTELIKRRLQSPARVLDKDANMIEQGYCDSLGFLEIIAAIESEFKIEVDLSDLEPESFITIAGLCTQITRIISASADKS